MTSRKVRYVASCLIGKTSNELLRDQCCPSCTIVLIRIWSRLYHRLVLLTSFLIFHHQSVPKYLHSPQWIDDYVSWPGQIFVRCVRKHGAQSEVDLLDLRRKK